MASSGVLEPIPHGYQRTTVLTMTLMITRKKLCLVKHNEFRFAELLVMQSSTFLKPYTHKVKVTSECLEDITALCQSKSPSAPCYPRGSRDVNIFLTTLFRPLPISTPSPLIAPLSQKIPAHPSQTCKSSIRLFGLSLRLLYPKLQNHSRPDCSHSQIH